MVPPPGMHVAVGERNHMAMGMHTRRHRFGGVHMVVMRVVSRFAGTAHARSGGGSAGQQCDCQGSQQANQCRSKHRVCPSPDGARFQQLLTRDMPVKPPHSGKTLNGALQIDQIPMFHVKHSICNAKTKGHSAGSECPTKYVQNPRRCG